MRARNILAAICLCLSALGSTAIAWDDSLTLKPFSAEYVVMNNGVPIAGMAPIKVAGDGKQLRVDFRTHASIVELRPGKAMVVTMMHGDKTYTRSSKPYDSEDLAAFLFMIVPTGGYAKMCEEQELSCSKAGTEKVEGRTAEVWLVKDPEEGDGKNWIDPALGILLKSTSGGGEGMLAKKISTAKPSADQFAVPKGYRLAK